MLAPWNGSHRKTGSGCRDLEAAAFVVRITVISKEQPVSGGGGASGSRFNVRDGKV